MADIPPLVTMLLLAGLPAQIVVVRLFERRTIGPSLYELLLAGTLASVVAGLWCLRREPGILVALLGIVLNLVVIAANGSMPIPPQLVPPNRTVDVIGGAPHVEGSKAAPLPASETKLWWLGDVLPFQLAHVRIVFSAGDGLVAAGLGWFVISISARTWRSRAFDGRMADGR